MRHLTIRLCSVRNCAPCKPTRQEELLELPHMMQRYKELKEELERELHTLMDIVRNYESMF